MISEKTDPKDDPPGLKQAFAEYKQHYDTLTELERALTERRIWDSSSRMREPGTRYGKFMAQRLGISERLASDRYCLINQGGSIDLLWKRVDDDMIVGTAVSLSRSAKQTAADEKIPFGEALAKVLAKYDSLPAMRTAGGKVIRRQQGKPMFPEHTDAHAKARRRGRPPTVAPSGVSNFWDDLRASIANYATERLIGVDPDTAIEVSKNLEVELRSVIDAWQTKLDYLRRKAGEDSAVIGRRSVLSACQTLHLASPRVGKPIDMKEAKKQRTRLVRLYHPDSNGGSEETRTLYEAVIEAYIILEQYNKDCAA